MVSILSNVLILQLFTKALRVHANWCLPAAITILLLDFTDHVSRITSAELGKLTGFTYIKPFFLFATFESL